MTPRLVHYSDVEHAYDEPERLGRLAGLLRSLDGPDALVLGTGDDTGPGALPLHAEGRQSLVLFDAVEPAAETFGNHDFDHGPARTLEIVRASPQPWVCANVRRDGEPFGADAGVVPWTVLTAGGERVGVVGITDPRTGAHNPGATGLDFLDPLPAARDAVATLRDEGVDHVVALSHLGGGDPALARSVDVDVVLGGHVHSEWVGTAAATLLTRPGVGGHVVLEVDLGRVAAGDGTAAVTRHPVADGPLDEGVAAAMRERSRAAGLAETVATVAEPVDRSEPVVFGGECRVGNLVADAYRWATGADVALQNSGGIRNGPALDGEVSRGDLVGLVPFDEPVVVAELPGEALAGVLSEITATDVTFDEDGWWHGHVSGATATFDRTGALRSATLAGEPLDPGGTYSLATSEYLLHTDDEFPSLRPTHRTGGHATQYEVVVEYAREVGIAPAVEGRLRRADAG